MGPDAPIDELDANGCTPLMYAVMSESRLVIEMLLNFSARREQVYEVHRLESYIPLVVVDMVL